MLLINLARKSLSLPSLPSLSLSPSLPSLPSALFISYLLSNVINRIRTKPIRSISSTIPTIVNIVIVLIIVYIELKTIRQFDITNGNQINIDNKSIHYTNDIIRSSNSNNRSVSLAYFHGFGSNSLSFKPIIDAQKRKVDKYKSDYFISAHDVPGFGFGIRDKFKPQSVFYRPLWNAKVGIKIMNSFRNNNNNNNNNNNSESNNVIICGHSMGSIPAMIAAIISKKHNRNVTLILECPALKLTNVNEKSINEKEIMINIMDKVDNLHPMQSKKKIVTLIYGCFLRIILYPIRICLQVILRSRYFWKKGLGIAYTRNVNEIKNDIFDSYRLAAYAREFDTDLLNFVNAQKGNDDDKVIGCGFPSTSIISEVSHMNLLLALCKLFVKVIIVHGNDDKVVPVSNSVSIFNEIQKNLNDDEKHNIELRIMKNIGHVPHEEDPEKLLDIINDVI